MSCFGAFIALHRLCLAMEGLSRAEAWLELDVKATGMVPGDQRVQGADGEAVRKPVTTLYEIVKLYLKEQKGQSNIEAGNARNPILSPPLLFLVVSSHSFFPAKVVCDS